MKKSLRQILSCLMELYRSRKSGICRQSEAKNHITNMITKRYDTIQDENISENFTTLATRPRHKNFLSTNQKTTFSACPCRLPLVTGGNLSSGQACHKDTPHLD